MSFGDYVKCFGGMGSGWIVAAMKEKNCTEMEGDLRHKGCVCVV